VRMNICGIPFEIIERDRNSRDDGNFGKCDTKDGKIYIDKEMTIEQKRATLVHEWMHAVYTLNGIDHSEVQVSVMATELFRNGFSLKLDR